MARLSTMVAVPLCLCLGIGLAAGQNTQGRNAQGNDPFDDNIFVQKAAYDNMTEVALAKLAESKTSNDQVKAFAQRMIKDHAKAEENLKKAASAAGLTLPTTIDEKHQKMVDQFKGLAGNNFDADYVKHMVPDHEKAVALFTQASKEAKNPAVKDYATKTLPVLEEHLAMAKKLAGK